MMLMIKVMMVIMIKVMIVMMMVMMMKMVMKMMMKMIEMDFHLKCWFSRYLVRSTLVFGSWIVIWSFDGTCHIFHIISYISMEPIPYHIILVHVM